MRLLYNRRREKNNIFPRHYKLLNQKKKLNLVLGGGYLFFSCWSVGLIGPIPNITGIGIALFYPPEVNGKTPLLKSPHTTYLSHRTQRNQAGTN